MFVEIMIKSNRDKLYGNELPENKRQILFINHTKSPFVILFPLCVSRVCFLASFCGIMLFPTYRLSTFHGFRHFQHSIKDVALLQQSGSFLSLSIFFLFVLFFLYLFDFLFRYLI